MPTHNKWVRSESFSNVLTLSLKCTEIVQGVEKKYQKNRTMN